MSNQQYAEFQSHQGGYGDHTQVQMTPQIGANPPMVTTFATESLAVPWSWCNLVTSVISLFCCSIFGVIATIMAILAYVDHRVNQFEMSLAKRNVAYGFAIASIVLGVIILVIVVIITATSINEAETLTNNMENIINKNQWQNSN